MPFSIVRNDITKMKADAIVNSSNPAPEIGGGSDYAVYEAADAEALLSERKKIGYIRPGEAAITRGFNLPARYVIHTVAPLWEDGRSGEADTLRKCYESCLHLAKRKHLSSVAFPLLAAGTLGFPKDKALTVALSSIQEFLMDSEMMIWLVVFDRSSFRLSEKLSKDIEEFIDDHYAREKAAEEYFEGFSNNISGAGRTDVSGAGHADVSETAGFADASGAGFTDASEEGYADVSDTCLADMSADELTEDFYLLQREERLRKRRERIREQIHEAPSRPDSDLFDDNALYAPSHESAHFMMPDAARPSAASYDTDRKHSFHKASRPSAYSGAEKRSMEDVLDELGETFQQALMRMIRERGLDNKDVYKRANLDRKVFSKIKGNPDYSPRKSTAIALAIALHLNMDEARDLLGRAGYAFSPGSKSDLIVEYFIENGVYDVYTIDTALFEHDLPMLSNYS